MLETACPDRQPHFRGRIEEAGDPERRIDAEARARDAGIVHLTLEGAADQGGGLAQIAEEIAQSEPHSRRHLFEVEAGQRVESERLELPVDRENQPVQRFERVVAFEAAQHVPIGQVGRGQRRTRADAASR